MCLCYVPTASGLRSGSAGCGGAVEWGSDEWQVWPENGANDVRVFQVGSSPRAGANNVTAAGSHYLDWYTIGNGVPSSISRWVWLGAVDAHQLSVQLTFTGAPDLEDRTSARDWIRVELRDLYGDPGQWILLGEVSYFHKLTYVGPLKVASVSLPVAVTGAVRPFELRLTLVLTAPYEEWIALTSVEVHMTQCVAPPGSAPLTADQLPAPFCWHGLQRLLAFDDAVTDPVIAYNFTTIYRDAVVKPAGYFDLQPPSYARWPASAPFPVHMLSRSGLTVFIRYMLRDIGHRGSGERLFSLTYNRAQLTQTGQDFFQLASQFFVFTVTRSSAEVRAKFQANRGVQLVAAAGPQNITTQWHSMAFVWDPTQTTAQAYYDGVLAANQTGLPAPINVTMWAYYPITFGAQGPPANLTTNPLMRPTNGLLDDISFFSTALSAAQVAQLHAGDCQVPVLANAVTGLCTSGGTAVSQMDPAPLRGQTTPATELATVTGRAAMTGGGTAFTVHFAFKVTQADGANQQLWEARDAAAGAAGPVLLGFLVTAAGAVVIELPPAAHANLGSAKTEDVVGFSPYLAIDGAVAATNRWITVTATRGPAVTDPIEVLLDGRLRTHSLMVGDAVSFAGGMLFTAGSSTAGNVASGVRFQLASIMVWDRQLTQPEVRSLAACPAIRFPVPPATTAPSPATNAPTPAAPSPSTSNSTGAPQPSMMMPPPPPPPLALPPTVPGATGEGVGDVTPIIGAAVGGLLCLLLLLLAAALLLRRRRRRRRDRDGLQTRPTGGPSAPTRSRRQSHSGHHRPLTEAIASDYVALPATETMELQSLSSGGAASSRQGGGRSRSSSRSRSRRRSAVMTSVSTAHDYRGVSGVGVAGWGGGDGVHQQAPQHMYSPYTPSQQQQAYPQEQQYDVRTYQQRPSVGGVAPPKPPPSYRGGGGSDDVTQYSNMPANLPSNNTPRSDSFSASGGARHTTQYTELQRSVSNNPNRHYAPSNYDSFQTPNRYESLSNQWNH